MNSMGNAAGKYIRSSFDCTVIYTDIGRGHPNYLDSVLRYIRQQSPDRYSRLRIVSIFNVSHWLSLWGWRFIRRLYKLGAHGGVVSETYNRFRSGRSEYNSESLVVRILQRDLLAFLEGYDGICLVAHPILANMLKDQRRVAYLHGEIAAPKESAVTNINKVYVPLPETLEKMVSMNVARCSLVETGLVIEPELLNDLDSVVNKRLQRINGSNPLTIGFFISGAYPKRHIQLIIKGAESCRKAGHKIRLFWGCEKKNVDRIVANIRRFDMSAKVDKIDDNSLIESSTVIISGYSRHDETLKSMKYIPQLDVFCAAPHERVNWAIGIGLPIIMITPTIGSFAPQNLDFVLRSGCGIELSTEGQFADLAGIIHRLRANGTLSRMVESGRRIESIQGAKVIAEDIFDFLG